MSNKLTVEGVMELREVIVRLEDVVAGMKKGLVHIRVDKDAVTLSPSSIVAFELKAKQKGDKESFSLKINWRRQTL